MATETFKYAFILNRKSGNGKGGRQWNKLESEIRSRVPEFTLFETAGHGDATRLVRQALHEGYTRIVSVGGDGTHFEVVNGFFEGTTPIGNGASLALLPMGTGSDLRKTLDLPKGASAIPFLTSTSVVRTDVGRITQHRADGDVIHHFFSSVHMGIGAVVSDEVNRHSKMLGGFMSFLMGVLSARFKYTPCRMEVTAHEANVSGILLEVVVAKGRFDGGGMKVGPRAVMNNGLFEVYTFGEMGLLASAMSMPRVYAGTQDTHPAVKYFRSSKVHVSASEAVLISPDGEIIGQLPATLEVVPAAVPIVVGPGAVYDPY